MGVFSPGERETFERIAGALEDCADSLKKIANPLFHVEVSEHQPTPHVKELQIEVKRSE
jgi:hypothetical protein